MGSGVAVKRAGVERREVDWSAAARDCGKARGEKTTVVRETKGERMCAPSGVLQESPWSTLEEST